ncbi:MAG: hypothetical protein IJC83_01910 [Oscillospiraceae bacterium]|nr:hypothetical protein [Oscillospiraceae bacterium]
MADYEKLYRELNEDVRRIIKELEYIVEKSERPLIEEYRKSCVENVQSLDYLSDLKPKK